MKEVEKIILPCIPLVKNQITYFMYLTHLYLFYQ